MLPSVLLGVLLTSALTAEAGVLRVEMACPVIGVKEREGGWTVDVGCGDFHGLVEGGRGRVFSRAGEGRASEPGALARASMVFERHSWVGVEADQPRPEVGQVVVLPAIQDDGSLSFPPRPEDDPLAGIGFGFGGTGYGGAGGGTGVGLGLGGLGASGYAELVHVRFAGATRVPVPPPDPWGMIPPRWVGPAVVEGRSVLPGERVGFDLLMDAVVLKVGDEVLVVREDLHECAFPCAELEQRLRERVAAEVGASPADARAFLLYLADDSLARRGAEVPVTEAWAGWQRAGRPVSVGQAEEMDGEVELEVGLAGRARARVERYLADGDLDGARRVAALLDLDTLPEVRASLAAATGDHQGALELWSRQHGARSELEKARAALGLGRPALAEQSALKVLETAELDPSLRAAALQARAEALALEGWGPATVEAATEASEAWEQVPGFAGLRGQLEAEVVSELGLVRQGGSDEAVRVLGDAASLAWDWGFPVVQARTREVRAEVAWAEGDARYALELLDAAVHHYLEAGAPTDVARANAMLIRWWDDPTDLWEHEIDELDPVVRGEVLARVVGTQRHLGLGFQARELLAEVLAGERVGADLPSMRLERARLAEPGERREAYAELTDVPTLEVRVPALCELAALELDGGDTRRGLELLERALELRRGVGHPDRLRPWLVVAADRVQVMGGDAGAALALATEATELELLEDLEQDEEARMLLVLGRLQAATGDLDGAEDTVRSVGRLAGGPSAEARLLRARIAEARGDWDEALRLLGPVEVAAVEAGDQALLTQVRETLAWVHLATGHHGEARSWAVLAQEAGGGQGLRVDTVLGALAYEEGDLEAAAAHWERALALARQASSRPDEAALLHDLGALALASGEFELARDRWEEALEVAAPAGSEGRVGLYDALVTTRSELAALEAGLGDSDGALEHALAAVRAAVDGGMGPQEASARAAAARVLLLAEDWPGAAEQIDATTALVDELGLPLVAVRAATLTGYLALGRGEDAAAAFTRAAEAAGELGVPAAEWEPAWQLGRIHLDAREPEAALPPLERAAAALDRLRGDAEGPVSTRIQVYEDLAAALLAVERAEEAFAVLGRLKGHELASMSPPPKPTLLDRRVVELDSRERRLTRQLQAELARPEAERREELVSELQAELDQVRLAFQDEVADLERAFPDLAHRLQVAPVGFFKLQAKLAPDEAFLEPLLLPDRVVLFVVRGDDTPLLLREVEVSATRVEELVASARRALQRPGAAWGPVRGATALSAAGAADPSAPMRELHDLLLGPLRGDLDGIRTLVVSPSGLLRYLPFAALHDGERFAVERFDLAVLTRAGAMERGGPIPRKAPLLALANPDGSLPGAEQEVEALTRRRRRAHSLFGAEATKEALRSSAPDHRILHLATHGVLVDSPPEASYLLLAEGGRLTFREIPLLDLAAADLVVLSACQTAVSERGEGREISGLAYQFEMRGAASVLATLWSVDDDSTATLMEAFYAGLHDRSTTRAQALRDAQLALLADPATAHPYHWAPFLLIGEWR